MFGRLICCFFLLAFLFEPLNPARAGDVSPDGLELIYFNVSVRSVKFVLKNVTNNTLHFDANGVFVGCRLNGQNKDFGHTFRNANLASGQTLKFKAKRRKGRGEWVLWPAYHMGGHYGPYKWNAVSFTDQPPQ